MSFWVNRSPQCCRLNSPSDRTGLEGTESETAGRASFLSGGSFSSRWTNLCASAPLLWAIGGLSGNIRLSQDLEPMLIQD